MNEWMNITWLLIHTLAFKLKNNSSNHAEEVFKQIKLICANLPCPECRNHATSSLKNINNIKTKQQLVDICFLFHNHVNKRLGKPQFTKKEHDIKYEKYNLEKVVIRFIEIMNRNSNNNRLMLDTFQRRIYIKKFENYFWANKDKYN